MKHLIPLVIGMALALSIEARAEPVSLEACKRMNKQIERYDTFRRHGGSAAKMESWKKSRASLEEKFRTGDCRKYGEAVRKAS